MDDLTFYINKHKQAYEKRRREEEEKERAKQSQKINEDNKGEVDTKNKYRVEAKNGRKVGTGNNSVNRKNAQTFSTDALANKFSKTSINAGIKQRIADNVKASSIPNISRENNATNIEDKRLRNKFFSKFNQEQVDRGLTQEEKDFLFAMQLNEKLNGPNSIDHLFNKHEKALKKENINKNDINEEDKKKNGRNLYGEEENIRAPDKSFVECLLGSNITNDYEGNFNNYHGSIYDSATPNLRDILSGMSPSDFSLLETPRLLSAPNNNNRRFYVSELDEHLALFGRGRHIPRWACRHPCIITCREEDCDDNNEYFNGWEDEEERFNLLDYALRTEERALARLTDGLRDRGRNTERIRATFFQRTGDNGLEFQRILDLLLGRNRESEREHDREMHTNEASELEVLNGHNKKEQTENATYGKRRNKEEIEVKKEGAKKDVEKEESEEGRKIKKGKTEIIKEEGNEDRKEKKKEKGEGEGEGEGEDEGKRERERKRERETGTRIITGTVEGVKIGVEIGTKRRYVKNDYLRNNTEMGIVNEKKHSVKNEGREKQKSKKTVQNMLTYSYIKEGDDIDYNDDSFIFNAKEVTNRMVVDLKQKYAILESASSNNTSIPVSALTNTNDDVNNGNKRKTERSNYETNILNTFNNLKNVEETNHEHVTVQVFRRSNNNIINNERDIEEVNNFSESTRFKNGIGIVQKPYDIKNKNNENANKQIRESEKNIQFTSKQKETEIKNGNKNTSSETNISKLEENDIDSHQIPKKKKYIYTCLIKKDDIFINEGTKEMKRTQKLEKESEKNFFRDIMDIANKVAEAFNKKENRHTQNFLNKYMQKDKEESIIGDGDSLNESQITEELENELDFDNEIYEHKN